MGVAKEVLDKLRAEKRTKEADEFQAALDEAVARDCVVIVTWTGEGDVDLLVEEPSGTVCSLRNPRTTAGGILLGDAIRQTGRDSFGGHSEVYVCPKGFDGTYRMLVRRVWGNVTAGKVNVEVITHYRTRQCDRRPQEDRAGQGRGAGGVRPEGRPPQGAAPRAAGGQRRGRPTGREPADSGPATRRRGRSGSRCRAWRCRGPAQRGNGGNGGGLPFFGGGAVGYQPVIIVLPEGANMIGITAVVSADRRYVRITAFAVLLRRVAGQHLQHGHRREPIAVGRHRQPGLQRRSSAAPATAAPAAAAWHRRRSLLIDVWHSMDQHSSSDPSPGGNDLPPDAGDLPLSCCWRSAGVRPDGPPRVRQSR